MMNPNKPSQKSIGISSPHSFNQLPIRPRINPRMIPAIAPIIAVTNISMFPSIQQLCIS
jgi:hypothetical protein